MTYKQRLLRFVLGNSESRKFMNFQSRHGNNECLSVYVYTSPIMGELYIHGGLLVAILLKKAMREP